MTVKIEVTGESSFCPGVERAFRIAGEILLGRGGRACSVGPLIHNPEVVSRLRMLGLEVIDPDEEPLPDLTGVRVVIRSHGVDTETEEKLVRRGAFLVDATCPTVKKAQEAARELAEPGCPVLVLGSASHPEVRSIAGRAGAPVKVIESAGEAERWLEGEGRDAGRVGIVCQTTISRELLDSVLSVIGSRVREVDVRDTICQSVARRREEAIALAGRVDLMLVVGGLNSSNTAHLASLCAETGVPTRHIEDASDIQPGWLEGVGSVGVTGGASTPDWQIEETVERLREITGG